MGFIFERYRRPDTPINTTTMPVGELARTRAVVDSCCTRYKLYRAQIYANIVIYDARLFCPPCIIFMYGTKLFIVPESRVKILLLSVNKSVIAYLGRRKNVGVGVPTKFPPGKTTSEENDYARSG